MANEKLILDAAVIGSSVVGLTVNMPEGLRGKGTLVKRGDFALYSGDAPDSELVVAYLAGRRREQDADPTLLRLRTPAEAHEALEAIAVMVQEINSQASEPCPPPDITWQRLE